MGLIHAAIPDVLHEKVKKLAWKEHKTISKWVRHAIEDKVDDAEFRENNEQSEENADENS